MSTAQVKAKSQQLGAQLIHLDPHSFGSSFVLLDLNADCFKIRLALIQTSTTGRRSINLPADRRTVTPPNESDGSQTVDCQQEVIQKSMPFIGSFLITSVSCILHWFYLAIRHVAQVSDRRQTQSLVFGSIHYHRGYLQRRRHARQLIKASIGNSNRQLTTGRPHCFSLHYLLLGAKQNEKAIRSQVGSSYT